MMQSSPQPNVPPAAEPGKVQPQQTEAEKRAQAEKKAQADKAAGNSNAGS